MADELEPRRITDDKEISRIIKRAAQLQEETGRRDAPGISIAELEQMASEIGINPAHIRQAVAELSGHDEESSKFSLWGKTLIESRRLAKGEVSEREWELMVQEIRRALGFTGETGKLGSALEWKTSDRELVTYQVTAGPREGGTHIRIASRGHGAVLLTYVFSGLAGFFGALAVAAPTFSSPLGLLAAGGILAGALTSARLLVGRWGRARERRINRLMERLESIIVARSQVSDPATALEQPSGNVTPPLLHGDDEQVEQRTSQRPRDLA